MITVHVSGLPTLDRSSPADGPGTVSPPFGEQIDADTLAFQVPSSSTLEDVKKILESCGEHMSLARWTYR